MSLDFQLSITMAELPYRRHTFHEAQWLRGQAGPGRPVLWRPHLVTLGHLAQRSQCVPTLDSMH